MVWKTAAEEVVLQSGTTLNRTLVVLKDDVVEGAADRLVTLNRTVVVLKVLPL